MINYQPLPRLKLLVVVVILLQACGHPARKITGFKQIKKVTLSEDSLVLPYLPDMLIAIDSQHIVYGGSSGVSIVMADIGNGNSISKFELAPFIDIGQLAVQYFKYDTSTAYYKKAYSYLVQTNAGHKPVKIEALQASKDRQFLFCTIEVPKVDVRLGTNATDNDTVVLHTSILYMVAEVNLQKDTVLQTHYYTPTGNSGNDPVLHFENTGVGSVIDDDVCYSGMMVRPDYKGPAIVKRDFPYLALAKAQPKIEYRPIIGLPPFFTRIIYFGKNDQGRLLASVDTRLIDVSSGKELADFSAMAKKNSLCISFIPIRNTDNQLFIANLIPVDSVHSVGDNVAHITLLNINTGQIIQQLPSQFSKLVSVDNNHFITISREGDHYVLETYEYVQ